MEQWSRCSRIQYTINDRAIRSAIALPPAQQTSAESREAHADRYGHTNANSRFNCGEITDANFPPAEYRAR